MTSGSSTSVSPHTGEPAAHRPALVLSPPDTFRPLFPFVIVAPVTTTGRGLSIHIEVESTDESGLDDISYIQCELLRSITGNDWYMDSDPSIQTSASGSQAWSRPS